MMRHFVADLHVHTVLSPCAAVEMTPRNIIQHALRMGVSIVAITDHNAGDNVSAACEASQGTGIVILPGMEVETCEEVHVLTLFASAEPFALWEAFVASRLAGFANDERRLGAQFVVDAQDELIRVRPDMLLTGIRAGIGEVADKVAELGGIVIASHIDRPSYSILSQLGMIPAGLVLAAVEISGRMLSDAVRQAVAGTNLPVIASSDAHTMHDFIYGSKTVFFMEEPSLPEIRKALNKEQGRETAVRPPIRSGY